MKTLEIEYLIELAEQASDPQEIEAGKEARKELNALLSAIAAQPCVQPTGCLGGKNHTIVSGNPRCIICGKDTASG